MKERPILFSAPMVRAIMSGTKTQTRRIVGLGTLRRSSTRGYDWQFRGQAPVRSISQQKRHPQGCWQDMREKAFLALCPYGGPGVRLWVRETWAPVSTFDPSPETGALYRADPIYDGMASFEWRWRPSIHMPRWASRITLEVTGVRVERVQEISEVDAYREGVVIPSHHAFTSNGNPELRNEARTEFQALWHEINGPGSWERNDWVWVVEFKRVEN